MERNIEKTEEMVLFTGIMTRYNISEVTKIIVFLLDGW